MSESAPETPGDWPETHDTSIRRLKNLGCIYAGGSLPPLRKIGFLGLNRKNIGFFCRSPKENFLDLHFSFKGFLIRNYIFEASEQKYFPSNSVFIYLPDPKLSKNQVFCGSTLFKFLTPKKNTIIILRINLFAKNTGIESTIGFKLK